jgi:hypothetical protein
MKPEQIKRLLEQALRKSNTGGPTYNAEKLIVQIELIIAMLDDGRTTDNSKDIGDIK